MGLFLSLSGIIGKSEVEVVDALRKYLKTVDGGLEPANIDNSHQNFCVLQEDSGNITIFYPSYFLKWEQCSNFLSKELRAPVFSLHIYDGDFWTYTLFFDGEIKDKFMPIPDYFDEDISQEEIDSWEGNPQIIVNYVPDLMKENIEKYLVRWDLDQEETKAYEDDEFTNCEDQLFDFMRKLKIPYQLNNNVPVGKVFRFWSKDLPLTEVPIGPFIVNAQAALPMNSKPWWKFW